MLNRRTFFSGLTSLLAGLPFVGKAATESTIFNDSILPWLAIIDGFVVAPNGKRLGRISCPFFKCLGVIRKKDSTQPVVFIEGEDGKIYGWKCLPGAEVIEWVSVDERLPECIENYHGSKTRGSEVCLMRLSWGKITLGICHIRDGISEWINMEHEPIPGTPECRVTHWAYFPKGPQIETKKD